MNLPAKIRTVEKFNEYQFKEKGSLFISRIYPVETEEQVSDILNKVKKKFYDATHHCYAYKLKNGAFKYSDDGEPSGTAGIRILNAIEHDSLLNQLIIIIRYYGGTKLGIGPLGKAYYIAARGVIEPSRISEKNLHQLMKIEADFSQISNIYHILNQQNAKIVEQKFSERVAFSAMITPDKIEEVRRFFTEILNNQAKIEVLEQFRYL